MPCRQFAIFVITAGLIGWLFLAFGLKKNSRKLITIGLSELLLIVYVACTLVIGQVATLVIWLAVLAFYLLYKLADKLIAPKRALPSDEEGAAGIG